MLQFFQVILHFNILINFGEFFSLIFEHLIKFFLLFVDCNGRFLLLILEFWCKDRNIMSQHYNLSLVLLFELKNGQFLVILETLVFKIIL